MAFTKSVKLEISVQMMLRMNPTANRIELMILSVLAVFEASCANMADDSPIMLYLLTSFDFIRAMIDSTRLTIPVHEQQQRRIDTTKFTIDQTL